MAVGGEVITYCGKCKLELRHVIVAHKADNNSPIAKVRCNTCNSIHLFRGKPGDKAESSGRRRALGDPKPREKARVIPMEVEWREQMSKAANKPSMKYSPAAKFSVGDVVEHTNFGAGVVRALRDSNKVEILFQHDIKTLVHGK